MLAFVVVKLGIIFFATLTLVLAFSLKLKHKKNYNYCLEHSKKIKALIELNEKYKFYDVNEVLEFDKGFKIKKQFNKTTPNGYFKEIIYNNLKFFSDLIDKVEYNKKQYYSYWLSMVAVERTEFNTLAFKISKKFESKMFEELKIQPNIKTEIIINLSYISPKGRTRLNKSERIGFADLKRNFNSVLNGLIEKETKQNFSKLERAKLTPALRYKIFCKDNFKCQICGKSAKDGVKLHVDHIIPISEGGRTELDNLRTLCKDCNLGKGKSLDKNPIRVIKNEKIIELEKMIKSE